MLIKKINGIFIVIRAKLGCRKSNIALSKNKRGVKEAHGGDKRSQHSPYGLMHAVL